MPLVAKLIVQQRVRRAARGPILGMPDRDPDKTSTTPPRGRKTKLKKIAPSHIWARQPFDPESLGDAREAARAPLPGPSYAPLARARLRQNAPRRDGAIPAGQHHC